MRSSLYSSPSCQYHSFPQHVPEISWRNRLASPPQDFVVYYETRLGIRREPNGDDGDDRDEGPTPRGGSDHAASHHPAAAVRANGGADLAVFEQFERMVRWLICASCLRIRC